jgi:hypothetical protein
MSNFKYPKIHSVLKDTEIQKHLKEAWEYNLEHGTDYSMIRFKETLTELLKDAVGITRGIRSTDNSWRSELSSKFSGRGGKWVFVTLVEIMPTIEKLMNDNKDVSEYKSWIEREEKAWIRFAGPRVHNGVNSGAFEVRINGSKLDHPKNLHYIPVDFIDGLTTRLPDGKTPHKLKIEANYEESKKEDETETVQETKEEIQAVDSENQIDELTETEIQETEIQETEIQETEIQETLTSPESDDPEEWEAWLKQNEMSAEVDDEGEELVYIDDEFSDLI